MKHLIPIFLFTLSPLIFCVESLAEELSNYCVCPSGEMKEPKLEEKGSVKAGIKIDQPKVMPLVISTSATKSGCQCLQPIYGDANFSSVPSQRTEKDLFMMMRKCQNGLMNGVCSDYCRLLEEVERIHPLCAHVSKTGNRTLPDDLKDIFEHTVSCDNIGATRRIGHDLVYRCQEQAKDTLAEIIQEIPSSVLGPLEQDFKRGSQSKSRFYQSIVEEAARWAPEKIGCFDTTALKYKEEGKEEVSSGMLVKLTATSCDTSSDADHVVCEQKSLPTKGADDRYLPLHIERESIPESLFKFLKQGTTPEDFWIKVLETKDTLRGRYQSRCRVSVY